MKKTIIMSLLLGLMSLESVVSAQGLIKAEQEPEISREDLIRRPPFYVIPQFEMKNAFEDAKTNYFNQLPGLLKGLKTGANFKENKVGNETAEGLRQRLDDTQSWESLILEVKLACQVELNSGACKKIYDLRTSYNHKYRRQSDEDRKAEKPSSAVQKKSEPAAKAVK